MKHNKLLSTKTSDMKFLVRKNNGVFNNRVTSFNFKSLYFVWLFIMPLLLNAQEENKAQITLSGYVNYEAFFDTYESIDTRDGEVYLYPMAENLDPDGIDINRNSQFQMLALQSRAKITASGLSAFGASVKGVIEGDFLGTSQGNTRMLRLRHAFVQMDWQSSNLIMGQYWHPLFVTDCFPTTLSMGAGAPFHPLNRTPQVRYTYSFGQNLSLMGALMVHGYHKNVGPSDAQRNSGLPEAQLQFKYNTKAFLGGFTVGYKSLTPRTETNFGYKTSETVGSYNLHAFTKLTFNPVTIKLEGHYGENLTHLVMIGGYGAAENPLLVDDYSYSNIKTMSVWGDIQTNHDQYVFALFGGYSANLGADDTYFDLNGYVRGIDSPTGKELVSIYRIAPRFVIKSGKMALGVEYNLTGAVYSDNFDEYHKAIETDDPTVNHRILFSAKYSF